MICSWLGSKELVRGSLHSVPKISMLHSKRWYCLVVCSTANYHLLAGSLRKDLPGCAWETSEQQYTSIKCLSEGLVG